MRDRKTYQKQYQIDNKERIKKQRVGYYFKNRNTILEDKREYYLENRDEILKQRKLYGTKNKSKIAQYQKQYGTILYENYKNHYREFIIYAGGECIVCGNKDKSLCFHHVVPDTKKFLISEAFGRTALSVWVELNKCELLCCTGHQWLHHKKEIIC